jgi:hypothetical protein
VNDTLLRSILWKTINIHDEFSDNFQLFVLPKEDHDFVKNQLEKGDEQEELLVDSFAKLFIAFYFDSIPSQIIANLKAYPVSQKNSEKSREYLLAVAGLLHEVKVAIYELSEILLPYLAAYQEFLHNDDPSISESSLLIEFQANVEQAIQAVIAY